MYTVKLLHTAEIHWHCYHFSWVYNITILSMHTTLDSVCVSITSVKLWEKSKRRTQLQSKYQPVCYCFLFSVSLSLCFLEFHVNIKLYNEFIMVAIEKLRAIYILGIKSARQKQKYLAVIGLKSANAYHWCRNINAKCFILKHKIWQ